MLISVMDNFARTFETTVRTQLSHHLA
jgi:hypothetical protein